MDNPQALLPIIFENSTGQAFKLESETIQKKWGGVKDLKETLQRFWEIGGGN